jgi:outer membrane lipoprotein-sorting protein
VKTANQPLGYNGETMALKNIAPFLLVLLLGVVQSFAQTPEPPAVPVEEIIRRFSEKEKEFKIARSIYTYRQDVKVQTLDGNDRVNGEFNLVSDIIFDSSGKRTEKIVYAPVANLKGISMTAEDMQDLKEIQPFVLTSDDIYKYDLKYAGKEKLDEIDCYAFDDSPNKIEKDQRYFEGKIWVDDRDFQIVKTYGKAVPDIRGKKGEENLFPKFETYREQIDGKYWFPTYTRAVDTLHFSSGPVRIREIVRYEKYKKFEADVKLTFGDVVDEKGNPVPATGTQKAPALDPKKADPKKKP